MSVSNHSSREKPFFRKTFGRRDSSDTRETLKERARAGKLKSSGSSIGKAPVKALSPEPLTTSLPRINTKEKQRDPYNHERERESVPIKSPSKASSILLKESSSSEQDYEPEGQTQSVRVAVRLRPLNPLEVLASKRTIPYISSPSKSDDAYDSFKAWNIEAHDGKDVLVQKGSGRKTEGKNMFTFDGVFQEDHSTSYVYENFARPIVRAVLAGNHGTIFTYGTSGSGKTHSMQGDGKNGSLHKDGIIQLAVRDLFNHIKRDSGKREYIMRISYFEVYNETVRDLLDTVGNSTTFNNQFQQHKSPSKSTHYRSPSKSAPKASPSVRAHSHSTHRFSFESPTFGTTPPGKGLAPGSEKKQVSSVDDVLRLLNAGNQNRAVATTILNDASSRSHAIFRLTIESRQRTTHGQRNGQHRHCNSHNNIASSTEGHIIRVSALNFVDLAGSENTTKAATVGSRRRESGKINQSLLSLSQVIHALSLPPKKRPKFINYRNSKLTRILQPHLSGNAVLAVLCCATPARANLEETRGTLKFGVSAKRIQMKPVVNEIVDDKALIKKLQRELKEAQEAIKVLAAEREEERAMVNIEREQIQGSSKECVPPHTTKATSPLPSPSSSKEGDSCGPSAVNDASASAIASAIGGTSGSTASGKADHDASRREICVEGSLASFSRERRMERSEVRAPSPITSRVEPSPLASPSATLTPERVSSPNNLINNKPYDIADLNAVFLDNRLRSADEDSKAEMSVQQDGNSTLTDLSSRQPPTIRVVQDSPPSEVTIIRSPLSDIGDEVDINVRLNDAEERAKFLEEKLESADRLVELMTRDLRNARLCIHELVFRNVRLENQLASNSKAGTTVPSTVDVTENHTRSDTDEDGNALMTSERIGI